MPDKHYENPQPAELYDLDSPWSADRVFIRLSPGRRLKEFSIRVAAPGAA